MEEIISPGRQVWIRYPSTDRDSEICFDVRVTKFKQFLPKGPVAHGEPPSYEGHRERDLLQFYSDRGLRTVAVSEVHLRDPRKKKP